MKVGGKNSDYRRSLGGTDVGGFPTLRKVRSRIHRHSFEGRGKNRRECDCGRREVFSVSGQQWFRAHTDRAWETEGFFE